MSRYYNIFLMLNIVIRRSIHWTVHVYYSIVAEDFKTVFLFGHLQALRHRSHIGSYRFGLWSTLSNDVPRWSDVAGQTVAVLKENFKNTIFEWVCVSDGLLRVCTICVPENMFKGDGTWEKQTLCTNLFTCVHTCFNTWVISPRSTFWEINSAPRRTGTSNVLPLPAVILQVVIAESIIM